MECKYAGIASLVSMGGRVGFGQVGGCGQVGGVGGEGMSRWEEWEGRVWAGGRSGRVWVGGEDMGRRRGCERGEQT